MRFLLEQIEDHLTPAFLLTLDDEVDVERRVAGFVEHRLVRLEQGEDLPLVVHRTTGVQLAIAHRGFERRGHPFVDGIHRLDIVVAVAQHGGFPFDPGTLRPYHRMPFALNELDHGTAERLNRSTSQFAARRQSSAWSGRVLMLGIRRNPESSSISGVLIHKWRVA